MSLISIIQSLCKSSAVVSGSGIGEDPEPVNPNDVTAVKNWYDVTDNAAIVVNTGRVTQLTDKKGTRNLTESLTLFPQYSASGGANNHPYITMNENQYIADTVGDWTGIGGAILFVVMKLTDLTPYLNGLGDYRNAIVGFSGRNAGLVMNTASYDESYMPMIYDTGGNTHFTVYKNALNTDWQIVIMKCFSNTEYYLNSQPPGLTCKTNISAQGPAQICLGYIGLTARFQCSELLFADSTITQQQELGIVKFLLNKYTIEPKQFIHCFGDSLTAGSCAPADNWVYMVSAERNLQLVNYGIGGSIIQPNNGSTGVTNKNLIDLYQSAFNWAYSGQWICFMYGVNDTNQGGINATWKQLYKNILQQFLDFGCDPSKMILSIPPSTSVRQATMAQTNAYIAEIADELGIVLYDANARFIANGGDSLFADSLHPSSDGNRVYADGLELIIL